MPETDLALLVRAAQKAGEIARNHWGKAPKVWHKPGQGPVSEADLEIDAALHAILSPARPDYGWLSEETPDSSDRLSAERLFIVDPLDGTRAFLNGDRGFAHALAVARAGAVQTAVVFLPLLDKIYTAQAGRGAWLNGVSLAASTRTDPEGAQVLTGRPALDPQHWAGTVPALRRAYRPSLAYRLCLVAEGRFDAMLTLRDSWHWDIAAGALVAQEAGARVSDSRGGALHFNILPPVAIGVLAAPPALHLALTARLR
ncbi:myo-inositol-1(or 4)-monophosphatase [Rhodovulum imhoffii]|uniref:Myo-inositol-1(Or 4)-monophosphatase n=1 Tax=Rhodovulum imhoffii TaxID=365340 RepID=A0A2T5BUV9_9RHOB|nr:3'(2'),5'-bisphosphate nucleotidase CysQ [Rhodovulum imhoffii]MBK5934905.1 3'(2'),5'-bisphosphate nucleotidase CysQ [Rhodovulum imhoffii]PTN03306.1 myo-inositol-1(or 4)-monophosphatase [Rhodovulum imhoffii]